MDCWITAGRDDDAITGREKSNQKGEKNVVDDCGCIADFMDAGVGDRLYDGVFYSYPAGHRHYCCADQSHSRAEAHLAKRRKEKVR